MGDGATVIPCEGVVTAPCDATISFVFDTNHAIGLELEDGVEMLIHVGINTVALKGQGFHALVKEGDQVKKGDRLLEFDLDFIRENATSVSSPVLFTSMEDNQELRLLKGRPRGARRGSAGPGYLRVLIKQARYLCRSVSVCTALQKFSTTTPSWP